MKRCAFYILFFISLACFVVSKSGGDTKQKRAQKLRSKAETMPENVMHKLQTAIKNVKVEEKVAKINDAHASCDDSSNSKDSALINKVMQDRDNLER